MATKVVNVLEWKQYAGNATDFIYAIYCDFTTFTEYTFTPKGPGISAGVPVNADGVVIDNLLSDKVVTVNIGGFIERVPPFTKTVVKLPGVNQVTISGSDILLVQFYTGTFNGSLNVANYYNSALQANLVAQTGIVSMFAGEVVDIPQGWLLCDGASISRTQYAGLFTKIGTKYGSAGSTVFNLPNYTNRTPRGVNAGGGINLGTIGGADTVALIEANLASHFHLASMNNSPQANILFSANGISFNAGGGAWRIGLVASDGVGSGEIYVPQMALSLVGGRTLNAGSGTAHENWPPFLGQYFIIKT